MPKKSTRDRRRSKQPELEVTQLLECDDKLSLNPLPSVIQYTQLFPIKAATRWGSRFFACHPLDKFVDLDGRAKSKVTKEIAASFQSQVPVLDAINRGVIPDPKARDRFQEKIQILNRADKKRLAAKNSAGRQSDSNRQQIHQAYEQLINTITSQQVATVCANIGSFIQVSTSDFTDPQKLSMAIAASSLFQPYFTNSMQYGVAILALYEQEWLHLGYSRGELIKALELAPGETVTLEYHYWDKSIIRTEDELSTELELKSSSTLTQRDTKQILDELTTTDQLHLNGKEGGTIKIPDTPVSLDVGADGGISTQVQPHVSNSINNTVEKVVNVSNTFSQNRKVRMEETRDTGREDKQTRVVANTNRCHTLQFNYFEIISNYKVTSRLATFRPCVLLPYQVKCCGKVITKGSINYHWILCNEDVLKSALLDKTFLPGFDAAKQVASFEKLKVLFKQAMAARTSSAGATSTSSGTGTLETDFSRYRDNIISDFSTVTRSAQPFIDFAHSLNLTDPVDTASKTISFVGRMANHPATFKHALYYVSLSIKTDALNALVALKNSKGRVPAERAITDFFAKVDENDFQFLDPLSGQISKFFVSFGVPDAAADLLAGVVEFFVTLEIGVLVGAAVGAVAAAAGSSETGPGAVIGGAIGLGVGAIAGGGAAALLIAMKDDAGLHDDVQAAQSFFKNTKLSPTGAVNEAPAGAATTASTTPTVFDLVSITDIADAEAELEKLVCHIKCNFEYYKQALWLSKDADYRTRFLIESGFAGFVTNEVVGFYDGYVAFPLVNLDYFNKVVNAKSLQANLDNIKVDERSENLAIPTSSTIVSGQLGECDLCEDYIDKSREADLRQQNAKAALDEAEVAYKNARTTIAQQEALRMEARLNAAPPDLSDPVDHSNAKIDVTVTNPNNP